MSRFQDEMFARWVNWIVQLDREVTQFRYRRVMYNGTVEMIQANNVPDSLYLVFLTRLYVDGQAMALRRFVKGGNDSVSMALILRQMIDHPTVVTGDRLVARALANEQDQTFRDEKEKWAKSGFEMWTSDGETLDPEVVRGHLQRLEDDTKKVVDFANRTVAHLDKRGWRSGLTFDALNANITDVGELHRDYYLLLTGGWKAMLTPAIQGDWRAPFRHNLTDALKDEDDDRLDS